MIPVQEIKNEIKNDNSNVFKENEKVVWRGNITNETYEGDCLPNSMSTKCAKRRSVSVCDTCNCLSDPRDKHNEYCMKSGKDSNNALLHRVNLARTSAADKE